MDIGKAQLLTIGWITPGPKWSLPLQTHPYHEMVVLCRGRMQVEIDGKKFAGEAGDVFFYRKGCVHTEQNDHRNLMAIYGLAFSWNDKGIASMPSHLRDSRGRLRQLGQWMHEESGADMRVQSGLGCEIFRAFLAEWLALPDVQEHMVVEKVRRFMRGHLSQPLCLEDLATAAGLSKFHFLRVYKQLTGRTPTEDLRILRLEAARHLLMTTNSPLKIIAEMIGLGDEVHLCRLFKSHYSMTPGDLRRSYTKSASERN